MADKRDRVVAIFIEESTEIIQQLETELMSLEESMWDKSIINEIFRGVHTLKGNANSFGFTKLGGFVHYFEDLLDYYRDSNHQLNENIMDIIFNSYDIIKEVFEYEKEGIDKYPQEYEKVLQKIKQSLDVKDDVAPVIVEKVIEKQHFHHDKFDQNELKLFSLSKKELIINTCEGGKKTI